jgi:hypothetical protein
MQYSLATIGRSALSECSEEPMKSFPKARPDSKYARGVEPGQPSE